MLMFEEGATIEVNSVAVGTLGEPQDTKMSVAAAARRHKVQARERVKFTIMGLFLTS